MDAAKQRASFLKTWMYNLEAFKRGWFCNKCGKFCRNCAGRSCVVCCLGGHMAAHNLAVAERMPHPTLVTHQDSMFKNTLRDRPFYSVHSQWRSEWVCDPNPDRPLNRPPWPWEQGRYKPNLQMTSTYVSPAQVEEGNGASENKANAPMPHELAEEVPPISYHLSRGYPSRRPHYIVRY